MDLELQEKIKDKEAEYDLILEAEYVNEVEKLVDIERCAHELMKLKGVTK